MGFLSKYTHHLFGGNVKQRCTIPQGRSVITDPSKIAIIFEGLIEDKRLINITIKDEDGSHSYSSIIINVNRKKNLFYLDELAHETGHQQMLQAKECNIDSHFEGVSIRLRAKLAGSGVSNGLSFYAANFPKELNYHQRRAFFRAHIPLTMNATAHIYIPEKAFVKGVVRDISSGGLNIEFENIPLDLVRSGEILKKCKIFLPGREALISPIEVCSFKRDHHSLRLGAKFLDISKDSHKKISRFVVQADRDMRKKKPLR